MSHALHQNPTTLCTVYTFHTQYLAHIVSIHLFVMRCWCERCAIMQATAAAATTAAASSLCANAVNMSGIAQHFALVENENRAHTSTVNNQYDGKPLLFTNSERTSAQKTDDVTR